MHTKYLHITVSTKTDTKLAMYDLQIFIAFKYVIKFRAQQLAVIYFFSLPMCLLPDQQNKF